MPSSGFLFSMNTVPRISLIQAMQDAASSSFPEVMSLWLSREPTITKLQSIGATLKALPSLRGGVDVCSYLI